MTHQLKNMLEMSLSTVQCPYCKNPINNKTVSREHIIPLSVNGSTDYRNKIWVCGTCNSLLKKNKVYGAKRLKNKTKKDAKGRIFIDDKDKRKAYISGIRGTIMKLLLEDDPIK